MFDVLWIPSGDKKIHFDGVFIGPDGKAHPWTPSTPHFDPIGLGDNVVGLSVCDHTKVYRNGSVVRFAMDFPPGQTLYYGYGCLTDKCPALSTERPLVRVWKCGVVLSENTLLIDGHDHGTRNQHKK